MSKTSQALVTPSKLLKRPSDTQHTSKMVPLKHLLMMPTKIPKLYSSFRPPSVPPRPKSQKDRYIKGLPSFLSEYLNCPESRPQSTTKRKLITQQTAKPLSNEITPNDISIKNTEKSSCSITPNPYPRDLKDYRKGSPGFIYKPYYIEISPRAKIRLYSPTPILSLSQCHNLSRTKKKKNKYAKNFEGDEKKDIEPRMLPVAINEYTRSYADKLKKLVELSEAAKSEARYNI